jgi:hypothetical protein
MIMDVSDGSLTLSDLVRSTFHSYLSIRLVSRAAACLPNALHYSRAVLFHALTPRVIASFGGPVPSRDYRRKSALSLIGYRHGSSPH